MEIAKTMTTEKQHSMLSPSSAHRWLNCTPSAKCETQYADEGSVYAAEGTAAHAVAAAAVARMVGHPKADKFENERKSAIEKMDDSDISEMEEYGENYAVFVKNVFEDMRERINTPWVDIEARLDMSEWVPECFGTVDCALVADGELHIIDFKYGRGVRVEAEDNPQLKLYALGMLGEYDLEYGIEKVKMTIWQPRLKHFATTEMSARDLYEWGEEYVRPLAEVAWRGLGSFQCGRWCKFCKHVPNCNQIDSLAGVAYSIDIDRQDARSLGEVCLPMVGPLELWISSVKEIAMKKMVQGETVPGYKLVRKRSQRKIIDPIRAAIELQHAGCDAADLFQPAKLRPLGELEKQFGKKKINDLIGHYILKPEGEMTIAALSDSREEADSSRWFEGIEV